MKSSRRELLAGLGLAGAAALEAQRPPRRKSWKPKLGILCSFSEANVEFARREGFTSIQLMTGAAMDAARIDDARIKHIKSTVQKAGLYLSAIGDTQNHIAADPAARAQANERFGKVIEMAGKMGVPYIGTASGKIPGKPYMEQVNEIVRVYTEKYFPLCEKHKVKILWEPWAGGPNIATGPVGYEALFKAFDNSPHVGLQFDPSHLQWQMMDPVACARDYADKIFDMHLKDAEILWPVVRKTGIEPINNARWWRFRLPGSGIVDWKGLFTVLMESGYQGAMNIEHEDELYYPAYENGEFTPQFKAGFRVAHEFLKTLVPA